jgi:type VI protein secretion system component Hcp
MAIGDNFMWDPDGNIEGESGDDYFSQWKAFEILKWSFCVNNGREAKADQKDEDEEEDKPKLTVKKPKVMPGNLSFQQIRVDKVVDCATASLYKLCCSEDAIPTLMLASRRSSGDGFIYLQYMFRQCHVTSIEWSGGSGTERAQENFTLSFKAMGLKYYQQSPDGRGAAQKSWLWNIVKLTANGKGTASLDVVDDHKVPNFLPALPTQTPGKK